MTDDEKLTLMHLHFLMQAQGSTETVKLNTDCPRCQKIMKLPGVTVEK